MVKSDFKYIKTVSINFLLLMLVFQFERLLFFVFNFSNFPDVTFISYLNMCRGAIRFDAAVLVYLNAIFILGMLLPFRWRENFQYRKILNIIFLITNSVGIFANLADIAYFPFTLRRTNASFFLEFKNDTNLLGEFLKYFSDYWYLIVIFFLIMFLLRKIVVRKVEFSESSDAWPKYIVKHLGILLVAAFFCVVAIRGTFKFKTRPIHVGYATEYVNRPSEVNIVLNTPFSILFTMGIRQIPEKKYYADVNELKRNFNPEQIFVGKKKIRTNVVFIIVESLSREFVGGLNKHIPGFVSYTPFLDSLIQCSYSSPITFANGRRSIEALPAVVASIPTLDESFVLTQYSGDEYKSLAHVLKNEGYATSFYHGAHRGSMGFWGFMKLAGFDKYYGQEDFGNDKYFDGTWGIWDEEFLQYWAKNLAHEQQPFFSCVFTLSSHNPYAIPERYKNKFNKSDIGIQNSASYTDNALRLFFNEAKKSKWYNNTLFVITADHVASRNYNEFYCSEVANYAAPILFFTPNGSVKAQLVNFPIQQTDIFPSVMDYLGMSDTIVAFGKSVFDSKNFDNKYSISCREGLYQLMTDSILLQYDGGKEEVIGLYEYRIDLHLKNDLRKGKRSETDKLLGILKAYLQQYTYRLRNNKLFPGRY